jgi:hypothetical protein
MSSVKRACIVTAHLIPRTELVGHNAELLENVCARDKVRLAVWIDAVPLKDMCELLGLWNVHGRPVDNCA